MEIKEIIIFAPDHVAAGPHIYTLGEGVSLIYVDANSVFVNFVAGHNPRTITYTSMPYIAKYADI